MTLCMDEGVELRCVGTSQVKVLCRTGSCARDYGKS